MDSRPAKRVSKPKRGHPRPRVQSQPQPVYQSQPVYRPVMYEQTYQSQPVYRPQMYEQQPIRPQMWDLESNDINMFWAPRDPRPVVDEDADDDEDERVPETQEIAESNEVEDVTEAVLTRKSDRKSWEPEE